MHRSKQHLYSITSSAMTSNDGGIGETMRLGGFELAGCSNLVGGRTGATSNTASLNAADVPKEPFFD